MVQFQKTPFVELPIICPAYSVVALFANVSLCYAVKTLKKELKLKTLWPLVCE
jgi:hypothetical protein